MDDNLVQALNMAFGVFVLVIALSLGMYMFSKVTTTAETLTFYADTTAYYDNIEMTEVPEGKDGTTRIVGADTVIPTLYRYYKENFCVKICDANKKLIQIFDVNLEGKVNSAIADTRAENQSDSSPKSNYAYKKIYNDESKPYYLFGAPWLGSTENIKTRIDYFINGKAGYINNTYVDYSENVFSEIINNPENKKKFQFEEQFISYSYTGQTMETEDGDTLVTGAKSKDKIVIIYTIKEI